MRFNGIDVGSISELAFDPDNPSSVIVTVQIDPTVPIQADSVASIQSQGFTGGTFLEIDGGSANSPLLTAQPGEQYPVIPSQPNTLQQLAQAGPELVANFNTVGVRVSDLLNDQNRKLIAESLATLAATLENVRATTDVFERRSEDLDATLENLPHRQRLDRQDARQCRQHARRCGPRARLGRQGPGFGRHCCRASQHGRRKRRHDDAEDRFALG